MTRFFTILAVLILCSAPLQAQTVKALSYTSNGVVLASVGTNAVTFTNRVAFNGGVSSLPAVPLVVTNLSDGITNVASVVKQGVLFAIGSSADESVLAVSWDLDTSFVGSKITVAGGVDHDVVFYSFDNDPEVVSQGWTIPLRQSRTFVFQGSIGAGGQGWVLDSFSGSASWVQTTNPATARTNLGLPLVALTNTSNVTMLRALSGSTNTNHPFSGTVSVVGTNNTNTLVFSNGILQSVQ